LGLLPVIIRVQKTVYVFLSEKVDDEQKPEGKNRSHWSMIVQSVQPTQISSEGKLKTIKRTHRRSPVYISK
jgi:hypothetical protein